MKLLLLTMLLSVAVNAKCPIAEADVACFKQELKSNEEMLYNMILNIVNLDKSPALLDIFKEGNDIIAAFEALSKLDFVSIWNSGSVAFQNSISQCWAVKLTFLKKCKISTHAFFAESCPAETVPYAGTLTCNCWNGWSGVTLAKGESAERGCVPESCACSDVAGQPKVNTEVAFNSLYSCFKK